MESPVLNSEETAAYINRTPSFVRETLKHEVPFHQRSTRGPLFFFKTDLDRWLAEHTQSPVR